MDQYRVAARPTHARARLQLRRRADLVRLVLVRDVEVPPVLAHERVAALARCVRLVADVLSAVVVRPNDCDRPGQLLVGIQVVDACVGVVVIVEAVAWVVALRLCLVQELVPEACARAHAGRSVDDHHVIDVLIRETQYRAVDIAVHPAEIVE